MSGTQWICCQLGAREHYAVPRVLHVANSLCNFITDAWVPPGNLFGLTTRMRDRFHPELATAPVQTWNFATTAFELQAQARRLHGWQLILLRNRWFQQKALDAIGRITASLDYDSKDAPALFTYSYAAHDILRFGKQQGWTTVLGQIDPGLSEERIVARITETSQLQHCDWQPAPAEYWDNWRKECELADRIVVNSTWSRDALLEEGITAEKIRIIPLAFKGTTRKVGFNREYPSVFSHGRPMRVLFLGQINLRKGAEPLLEAVKLLSGEPIEFWFVGPIQIPVSAQLKRERQARWLGSVSRSETAGYYRQADLFIFPTFSDGFGLTQLEAQAWRLPIVASKFCGDVVRNGKNGILLPEVSGEAIAKVLLDLAHNPDRLREMAAQSGVDEKFSLSSLASSLLNL